MRRGGFANIYAVAAVAVVTILAAAGFLVKLRTSQTLGEPGLKVSRVEGSERLKIELPADLPGYTSEEVEPSPQELGTLPEDTSFGKRLYAAPDGFNVFAMTVLMGSDRTSIHKPQFCLTGQGWRIEKSEYDTVPIKEPYEYQLPVMKLTSTKTVKTEGGQVVEIKGLFVYWFVAEECVTARHWERMWEISKNLITRGVLQRWAYVSAFSTCQSGNEDVTYERIKEWITAAVPRFQTTTGVRNDKAAD
ncbi:MAG: EpsI family protein [Verrucomicrobia bacterium]|nr:EpsI family protein [Verrucomicrobiota bacterium]MCF7708707.1 EpsI family protein [Verrucomicrobiota bacterium]